MQRHVPTFVLLGLGGLYVVAGWLWATFLTVGDPMAYHYRPWLVAYLVTVQVLLVLVDYSGGLGIKPFVQFLASALGFSVFNRAVPSPDPNFAWFFVLLLASSIWVWVRRVRKACSGN